MSARGSKDVRLVFGASPRVDLLPPEVGDRKKGAALRRAIVMGIVTALLRSAGAYALASWQAIQEAVKLGDAQSETVALLKQQSEFVEVRNLSAQRDAVSDARMAGALTEIDWSAFYSEVMPTVPSGVVIDSFLVSTSSPVREYIGTDVPTVTKPAAQVGFTVKSPDLATLGLWLVNLHALPGYEQATVTPATSALGAFSATVTLNLADSRFTKRFAPPEEPVDTADPAVAPVDTVEVEGTN